MGGWPARVGVLVVVGILLVAWPFSLDSSSSHLAPTPHPALNAKSVAMCSQGAGCRSGSSAPSPGRPTPSNNSSGSGGSNGSSGWIQLGLSGNGSAPGDRTQPSFAYDPDLGKIVMFGGYDGYGNTQRGDTWTFQNGTWTDLTSSLTTAPPARWGGQMVWDPSDQLLVMFGGRSLNQFFNDTWTFNGTAWVNVTNSVAPQPRAHYEMAYDPVDRYILLVSGDIEEISTGTWFDYNDTWSWSNGTWSNITNLVSGTLSPRIYGQAAYDPWNSSVVVEAGTPGEGCVSGSPVTTYRNYTAWSYPMSVGPQNVSEGMMAYDPLGPFLFAYGGQLTQAAGCPQTNETWVRANGTWVEITDSAGLPPTARYLSGIAYDAHDSEIVLFGGNSLGGYMSDTWVYRIQPIVARIVAPRNVSGAPFVATFTANATGGSEVYSYNWSFGDGNYSTRGATVNHTYTRVGNYSIVLNVTDLLGRNGSTNLTVHVVRPLSASAGVSATVGAVPFLVNFTVSASGGYGAYTYNWTFGDGASASGTAVSHTYTVAGNYTAAITVRDQSGESNRTFFLIQVAPRLSVSAETSSTSGIVPFEVNFSAIPAGGNPPYGYQWNFGDGGGASSQVASHVYTVAGTYLASVNLTDRLGHRSEYSTVVHAYAPLSVSPQSNVSTGVAPLPVSLTASSSGGDGLGNFTWNFGDGSSPGYGPDQDHVFSTAKTYTVSVTVSDLNRSTTSSLVITTVDPLTLHLSTLTTSGEVGLSFQFTASLAGGEAPIAVSWNFGDGATAVGGFVQNHTYARAGSYTVRLAASDALAERSSASVVVGVVRALSVAVTDAASSVVLGSSDNLTATIAGGGTPYTLVWSGLPPGCPASPTPSITCTPSAVGSYTITLNVSDQFGVHAAGSIAMVVTAPPAPTLSGSGTSSFPLTLLLLGGVAAAVVVVAAVVLLRRRRNVGASPDESPESVEEVPGDESP